MNRWDIVAFAYFSFAFAPSLIVGYKIWDIPKLWGATYGGRGAIPAKELQLFGFVAIPIVTCALLWAALANVLVFAKQPVSLWFVALVAVAIAGALCALGHLVRRTKEVRVIT